MSLTYVAALATLISSLGILGYEDALNFLNAAILVVTTIITLYGRYRAGGLTKIGMRK